MNLNVRRNALAIIPARGGSKGLPRKNVLPLCGKPLIVWTIEAALAARSVDRVVVSTDDAEIARIAQAAGADVAMRPEEISGDSASSEAALLHVLEQLQTQEDYRPDLLVFLQCTAPLTLPEDIDGTVGALTDHEADTALAVTDFHYFLWKEDGCDVVGINHDKAIRKLRQDREPEYLETGAVYVMRTEGFLKTRHRFFGKTAMYVIPFDRCHEIDEPVDFQVAEVLLRNRYQKRRESLLPNPVSAVIFDFDGVFTDNRVHVTQAGEEAVCCNRGDGWGLTRLRELGIPILVLSSETNPVVEARCQKLRLECITGRLDKWSTLRDWLKQRGIENDNTVFVGNDENDVECLREVGCGVVVADAHESARAEATLILDSLGGHGAVRELCDMIITANTASPHTSKDQ